MSSRLIEQFPVSLDAARVFKASRFIFNYCQKQAQNLDVFISTLSCVYDKKDYEEKLSLVSFNLNEIAFKKKLREFRAAETARIAWRSIINLAKVEETLLELSYLADCLVLHALSYATKQLQEKNPHVNVPEDELQLYVIALGKLGGHELNFSSDIDIYFAYEKEASLSDESSMMMSQWQTIVAQKVVHLLADNTADGFCYRVDLRLRPYGQSGPLVMSFAQLETYYQEQGRDWERYSLVKARVINHQDDNVKHLIDILKPFTYRRYTDFSILESLRSLKLLMAREEKLKKMADDIKRGPGGIREIEFLVQSLQLIHGGRDKRLQNASLLIALSKLVKKKLITVSVANELKEAYSFFRLVENALQFYEDKQRHKLPSQEEAQQALCAALNIESYETLIERIIKFREFVKTLFSGVLVQQSGRDNEDEKLLEKQLRALWLGQLGDIPAIDVLASLGFNEAEKAYTQLQTFAASPKCCRLSQVARLRLDNFMPLLLLELSKGEDIDYLLVLMLRLLDRIIKRSAYLALLIENPAALGFVVTLFKRSKLIANLLSEQPFLLEVLLDEEQLLKPIKHPELQLVLSDILSELEDTESKLERLKEFKHQQTLKIAARQVLGQSDAQAISAELAIVAEVILKEVLTIAYAELSSKHNDRALKPYLLIVAYGKLGSREMSYTSDLDLVFLHDYAEDEAAYAAKLAQKVLHLLQTRTVHGKLYQVDTRLRPSGSAGMLVSHIDAFVDYQKQRAWTWEHQALVKARALAGDDVLKQRFAKLRFDQLCLSRDKHNLYEEIATMLDKIRNDFSATSKFDGVKFASGGLIEIEFLVQFAVLYFSSKHPSLSDSGNTSDLLIALRDLSLIDGFDVDILLKSYQALSQSLHWRGLQDYQEHDDYHSELVHELVKKTYQSWLQD